MMAVTPTAQETSPGGIHPMNITLKLTPQVERRINEEAAKRGMTVEDYVQLLAEQSVSSSDEAPVVSPADWEWELRLWAASHAALPRPAADDRESIYAGRGE
jgi:hypothetical protein